MGQDIEGIPGKDGKTVRTCFGMADMDAHGGTADILITEGTDFPHPKAGRIHKRKNRLMFKVGKGLDEIPGFLLRRDIRKIGIESAHGKLRGIPGLMQDIYGKKAKLRDTAVDGTVREIFFFLEPSDKIAQFGPGNIFGHLVENVGKIIKVSPDVGGISGNSMVSKTTEGDHLPELF